jgi:hypothetical protein
MAFAASADLLLFTIDNDGCYSVRHIVRKNIARILVIPGKLFIRQMAHKQSGSHPLWSKSHKKCSRLLLVGSIAPA